MRHGNHNRKLGRERGQRKALMRSLMRSPTLHGKIQTTEAKAKELRPAIEKLLTKGRSSTLANRRILVAELGSNAVANKLIKVATAYEGRAGGYTRITKLQPRKGDGAKMAVIEFV